MVAFEVPELLRKAEDRAHQTVEWLLDNGMVLILQKSMLIVQATKELRRVKQIPDNMTLNVSGVAVKCVTSAKLLGLTLNQDITWEQHLWGHKGENNQKGLLQWACGSLGCCSTWHCGEANGCRNHTSRGSGTTSPPQRGRWSFSKDCKTRCYEYYRAPKTG